MAWKPNINQLCIIAELAQARAPVATIADALHITAHDFIEWRRSMLNAASAEATERDAVAKRAPRHWSGPR